MLVATLILVQKEDATRLKRQRGSWRTAIVSAPLIAAVLVAPIWVAGKSQNLERLSPAELVRAAVANEIAASKDSSIKHMFRARRQTPRGSQTRLYVETRDAMAGLVVAYNDQPLTPQQLQAEEGHLQWLLDNPEQLRRKRSQEKEDAERTMRIVRALPDAFLYEYDASENGGSGKIAGSRLVRLNFRPNPSYSPPSRVEQVLTGMQGFLLIDQGARRIAKIDGTLFRDVTFGWGILGHLDKRGHFEVEQADVGDGTWQITHMSLRFTGKIMLVKGISIATDEVFSDYRRVPADITFAQAVELLKTEQAKLALKSGTETAGTNKTPQ